MKDTFEMEFEKFAERQKRTASIGRLEHLERDLIGTKKLFQEALFPVFKSFDGFTLEHEIVSVSGVHIYIDAFYAPLNFAFESEGFAVHAEKITRDRFSFERMRVRTMAMYGYRYIPFTWDELDKHAERSRRAVYELLGRYTGIDNNAYKDLTVYEREVLRFALGLNRDIRLQDAQYCLGLSSKPARVVLQSLVNKHLLKPVRFGKQRIHRLTLDSRAREYLL